MTGKIIAALAAAALLGSTVLASAEPKSDAHKGANAAQRSDRAAKADRMAPRGDRWSESDASGLAANQPFYFFEGAPGRTYYDMAPGYMAPGTYYDMAPGMAPAAVPPYAPGGYCDYVNTHYDVYVGGDGC